jgi:hypothetical protein
MKLQENAVLEDIVERCKNWAERVVIRKNLEELVAIDRARLEIKSNAEVKALEIQAEERQHAEECKALAGTKIVEAWSNVPNRRDMLKKRKAGTLTFDHQGDQVLMIDNAPAAASARTKKSRRQQPSKRANDVESDPRPAPEQPQNGVPAAQAVPNSESETAAQAVPNSESETAAQAVSATEYETDSDQDDPMDESDSGSLFGVGGRSLFE